MRQDQKGELSGMIQGRVSGTNTGPVLALLDRMYTSNHFPAVSQQAHDTNDSNKEAQFTINFVYQQASGQPAQQGNGQRNATQQRSAPVQATRK